MLLLIICTVYSIKYMLMRSHFKCGRHSFANSQNGSVCYESSFFPFNCNNLKANCYGFLVFFLKNYFQLDDLGGSSRIKLEISTSLMNF